MHSIRGTLGAWDQAFDEQGGDAADLTLQLTPTAEFPGRQVEREEGIRALNQNLGSGPGVGTIKGPRPGALPEDVLEYFRLVLEVDFTAGEESRAQGRKEVAQALGIVNDAVETEKDAQDEHLAEAPVRRFGRAGDLSELRDYPLGDAVYMGQDQLFLPGEMEIDGALADPDLAGHVLHGHLIVAVPRQKNVHGIKDEIPDIFTFSDLSHDDL
jgi:hypothetical protein